MKNFKLKLIRSLTLFMGLMCASSYGVAQSSLTTFKLDFKTGKVEPSDLPFEVPFIITGTLDKNTSSLELSYVELTEKELLQIITPGENKCNCAKTCNEIQNCLGRKTTPCQKLCVQLFPGENNTMSFSAVVPPLKPNRYYVFLSSSKRNPPGTEETNDLLKIVSGVYLNDLDMLVSRLGTLPDANKVLNAYTKPHIDSLGNKIENEIKSYYLNKGYTSVSTLNRDSSFLTEFAKNSLLIEAYLDRRNAAVNYQNTYSKSVLPKLDTLRVMPAFDLLLNNGAALHLNSTSTQIMQFIRLGASDANLYFAGLWDGSCKPLGTMQEQVLLGLSDEDIGKAICNLITMRNQVQECRRQLAALPGDASLAPLLKALGLTAADINGVVSALDNLSLMTGPELGNLNALLTARQQLDKLLKAATLRFIPTLNLAAANFGLASAEFKARAEWYIVPDIGIGYSAVPGDPGFFSYAGVNFNPWPINRQHKYSLFDRSTYLGYGRGYKNLSLVIGLTTKNLSVETTRISGALNNKGMLIGGALRLNDYVRFTAGGLLFRQQVNPLQGEKTIYATCFFALSLDLDVKKYLGDFATLLN